MVSYVICEDFKGKRKWFRKMTMLASHFASITSKMLSVSTSDHASVVSLNLFVALLCACIVIGHLLEENRWMNESITALLIVSSLDPSILRGRMVATIGGLSYKFLHCGYYHTNVSSLVTFQKFGCRGFVLVSSFY